MATRPQSTQPWPYPGQSPPVASNHPVEFGGLGLSIVDHAC